MKIKKSIIAVNAISLGSGGALRVLVSFIDEIKKKAEAKHLYIFYIQEGLAFQNTENIKFFSVKRKNRVSLILWHLYGFYKTVKACVDVKDIKLVISLQNFDVYFPKKQRIVYFHQAQILNYKSLGLSWKYKTKFCLYAFMYYISVKTANTLVVQNQWTKELHKKRYDKFFNKIIVLNPFSILDTEYLANIVKKDNLEVLDRYQLQQKNYFFYPAFFHPHKNHHVLFEAITLLYQQQTTKMFDVKFVFTIDRKVIPGNMPKTVKDRIVCLGEISYDDTAVLLKHSKGLLFSSKAETLGLPLLEAILLSTPVIVSREAYAIELLKNYASVIFCQSDDKLCWADGISYLLKNNEVMEMSPKRYSTNMPSLLNIIEEKLKRV